MFIQRFLFLQNNRNYLLGQYQGKIMSNNDIGSSKQNFQSDDSQGSDLSYQSSLTDQGENTLGNIDFFKEDMARFFINYPQLINKNIIADDAQKASQNYIPGAEDEINKKNRIMNHWQNIAQEVLNEAKEQHISLQNLAKRIALYRHKIDESDIIDLLLQQKQIILKQLDTEIAHQFNEDNHLNLLQKSDNIIESKNKQENNYYSWVNRKILKSKYINDEIEKKNTNKIMMNHPVLDSQTKIAKKNQNRSLTKSRTVLDSNNATNYQSKRSWSKSVSNFKRPKPLGAVSKGQRQQATNQSRHLDESQISHDNRQKSVKHQWKHLLAFQPKTQIAKQLSQEIKKFNPKDQLGIKRAIIIFLDRYKEMINNEIINKVTLNQKIQKLYNEDAKQLLMFYPSKVNNFDSNLINNNNTIKENKVQDKLMLLLKEINEGPLMKYWRQTQGSKI